MEMTDSFHLADIVLNDSSERYHNRRGNGVGMAHAGNR